MAEKSIDDVFAEILKDSRAIAVEVIESSAKNAQIDFLLKARSLVDKYYDNYTPRYYKRTNQLKKSIVPVFEGKTKKGSPEVTIRVGVEYDSTLLEGLYQSNSRWHQSGDTWKPVQDYSEESFRSDYGVPEPGWILDNFLKGYHPWAQNDGESTNKLMKKFVEKEIDDILNGYIQSALMDALQKRL